MGAYDCGRKVGLHNCLLLVVFLEGNWRRYGFTNEELVVLSELYEKSGGYPSKDERKRLIARFGFLDKKVYNWFNG